MLARRVKVDIVAPNWTIMTQNTWSNDKTGKNAITNGPELQTSSIATEQFINETIKLS